jgi:hypothetical protein
MSAQIYENGIRIITTPVNTDDIGETQDGRQETGSVANIDRVIKFEMQRGGIKWTVTTRNSLAEIKASLAKYEGKKVKVQMVQGPARHVITAGTKFGIEVKPRQR